MLIEAPRSSFDDPLYANLMVETKKKAVPFHLCDDETSNWPSYARQPFLHDMKTYGFVC